MGQANVLPSLSLSVGEASHVLLYAVTPFLGDLCQVVIAVGGDDDQRAAVVAEGTQGLTILYSKLSVTPLAVKVLRQEFFHK